MKVLFVSAEVAPFSSVGGLSQVSYLLPKALMKLGVDVRIFTPKYGIIDASRFPMKKVIEGFEVPTEEKPGSNLPQKLICNVTSLTRTKKEEPPVYFLENMEYFEKRANVYNYSDDHIRFGLLSRGALEFIRKKIFIPDIIHCNDWHTGYLIDYLRNFYEENPIFDKIATVLTIHNLYQGIFDFDHASEVDMDDGKSLLASFYQDRFLKQNPLRRGVLYTDVINTVSETYSKEILLETYGGKLCNLFKELRGKLFGILNGLDYEDFNPRTDKIIKKNYSLSDLELRVQNKTDLQKEFSLNISEKTPILAVSGRLDSQKGLDLIMDTLDFVLDEFDVQFIILGSGDDKYRDYFQNLEKKFPRRVGTHLMRNFALPRKIFAGADVLLMPSKYEPGGIVALEAMRYGCVPVVRATGGLADSVMDFDPQKDTGNGFSFKNFSEMSLLVAITRALETYKNQNLWKKIVRRAMQQDFSWDYSAKLYLDLYQRAVSLRQDTRELNPPLGEGRGIF